MLNHELADLVERVAAAGALRRLAHALFVHEVDDVTLVEIATLAARITTTVESGPGAARRPPSRARLRGNRPQDMIRFVYCSSSATRAGTRA